jgi:hypothetical protein
MEPNRMNDHYLILEWAEEPGAGTWDDDLDWHITHPPECEWVVTDPDHNDGNYQCGIQWEIDNVGIEAIPNRQHYPDHPAALPVVHFYNKTWVENGSHRGWAHYTAIIPKEPA